MRGADENSILSTSWASVCSFEIFGEVGGKIARILRIFFLFACDFSMEWNPSWPHRHRTSGSLHILFPLFGTPSSTFPFPSSHVSTLPVFFTSLKPFVHQVPAKMWLLQEVFLGLSVWLLPQLPSDGDICHWDLLLYTIRLLDTGIVPALFTTVSQVLHGTWDKVGDEFLLTL